jgi:RNase P/RNase MRP subunit p29
MKRNVILGCLAAGLLALVGGGLAWAQSPVALPPQHEHQTVQGTVVQVGEDRLTILTTDGEVEVTTDKATRYRLQGNTVLEMDDRVVIRADVLEDGSLRAEVVAQALKPRLAAFAVRGGVVAIEDDDIAVQPQAGPERLVRMDAETRIWAPPEPPTTTVSLQVGDEVLAVGRPEPDSGEPPVLLARLILVASDEELPRYVIRGQVVAVTRQTAVVRTGERERAITFGPRTRIVGKPWPRVGDHLLALGQPTPLGQWIAGVVYLPGRQPPGDQEARGDAMVAGLDGG